MESLQLLTKAHVIGLTTTGAAKNHNLLRLLDPKIIIIEEAGQVLESHILACLTPNLEQLVLIGDHQQLKPTVSTYEMAKTYGLDVSLFERLILNGFEHVQLKEQHRMRPEISRIIKESFYHDLKDHISVKRYPKIKGIHKSIFFVHHNQVEDKVQDGMSKINEYEALYLLKLAKYLKSQEYQPSQITILTTYLGQMMFIKSRDPKIDVQVVDNYQGEENDIILLSLVRSNEQGSIGYLSVQSRICVALSRAKMGLYIIGNMSDLCHKSSIWKSIKMQLERENGIGSNLTLECPYHPNSQINIRVLEDFDKKVCSVQCEMVLNCGHTCHFPCHVQDRDHRDIYKCQQLCNKSCVQGHPCLKLCSEPCHPCLSTESKILACNHLNDVPCLTNNFPIICKFIVKIKFSCGHTRDTFCGDIDPQCQEICDVQLDNCGHFCGLNCHNTKQTGHNRKCSEPCNKIKNNCFFKIHQCNKLCFQICEDCDEVIPQYDLKCGHTVKDMKCSMIENFSCMKKCDKYLSCGIHQCKNYCYECFEEGSCPPCTVQVEKSLPCGHIQVTSCQNDLMDKCMEPCLKHLSCGHI